MILRAPLWTLDAGSWQLAGGSLPASAQSQGRAAPKDSAEACANSKSWRGYTPRPMVAITAMTSTAASAGDRRNGVSSSSGFEIHMKTTTRM